MIAINSSPAINLTAVLGGLDLLVDLYGPVIVPLEVSQELEAGASKDGTALKEDRMSDDPRVAVGREFSRRLRLDASQRENTRQRHGVESSW